MRNLLAKAIFVYQSLISPFYPPCCRFYPSCSEYARQAVLVHGVLKGSCLALWRIARCNPLCRGGVDPVPQPRLKSTT
ncbi:MAG: membrane protein insertion efficiency factor YidD [Desulfoplanes sp.]|nr:membrane protein insertion efficiency factor YidD [Desulfoplanes sp.]MDD4650174.1 membrane protein insertion efficiency factor YidD [Desulfoplanes sp.]